MEFVLLVFLGFLPSLVWLWFYLLEDPLPEPRKRLFFVFLIGVGVAPAIYLTEEFFLPSFGVERGIAAAGLGITLISFFGVSIIEEFGKYFSAYLGTLKNKYFDEPVDAMIYIIVAALGFAAAENIAVMFASMHQGGGVGDSLEITVFRFFGATFLHTLASASLGYYWAKSLVSGKKHFMAYGFAAAIALHTVFNWSIILLNAITVYIGVILFVAAIFVLKDFQELKRRHVNLVN